VLREARLELVVVLRHRLRKQVLLAWLRHARKGKRDRKGGNAGEGQRGEDLAHLARHLDTCDARAMT